MSSGCIRKCRACGGGMCSPTRSPPAWRVMCTETRAECEGRRGCGTNEQTKGGTMKRVILLSAAVASTAALAGPEKIKFPADYLKGELYQTLDRPDNKQ